MRVSDLITNLRALAQTLGRSRLIALGVVGALVFAGVVAAPIVLTRPDMAPLYANLDDQEAGKVVAALEQMGARHVVSGDGAILVQADQAARWRMALAEQGLPRAGGLGYELFDEQRTLGLTTFMQRINRTRALEGELARSILALEGVEGARVHLVLPERDAFTREPAAPTASVVVRTQTAGALSADHAAAIRHLVAAAVPRLAPDAVTVLDAAHGVVSAPRGGAAASAAAAGDARRQVEADLRLAVERMLTPVLGAGNIRVEIAAELVTAREVIREQTFDPRGGALRSEQTVEASDDSRESDETGAVTIEQNLPEPNLNETGESSAASSSERVEQTRNYEVSSLTRERVLEPGDVKRVAAAVIVNAAAPGLTVSGADGEGAGALDAAALARIEELVRAAVGFTPARGDVVRVDALPFTDAPLTVTNQPLSPTELVATHLDDTVKWTAVMIIGGLVVLFVLRPAMNRVLDVREEATELAQTSLTPLGRVAAAGDSDDAEDPVEGAEDGDSAIKALPSPTIEDTLDRMMDVRAVEGQVRASSLHKLGLIVEENPDEAVAILRSWIYEEAA